MIVDDLSINQQIDNARSRVQEFEELKQAESELQELQKIKRQEQVKQNELDEMERLSKSIDAMAQGVDNSLLIAIGQKVLELSKLLAQWKGHQNKNAQLFELLKAEIRLRLKYRLVDLNAGQINALQQGMGAGLIDDLAKERMNDLGINQDFDIVLIDNDNQLNDSEKSWFDFIVGNIKNALFPKSNHSEIL